MSKENIIRSNVFVICNQEGSVYEVTDQEEVIRVNLRQITSWYEGTKLCQEVRDVEWDTGIALYKKGSILPGNILLGLTLEQLSEDPYEYLLMDEDYVPVMTDREEPIYQFYYYSASSKFEPTGVLVLDDCLEDILCSH